MTTNFNYEWPEVRPVTLLREQFYRQWLAAGGAPLQPFLGGIEYVPRLCLEQRQRESRPAFNFYWRLPPPWHGQYISVVRVGPGLAFDQAVTVLDRVGIVLSPSALSQARSQFVRDWQAYEKALVQAQGRLPSYPLFTPGISWQFYREPSTGTQRNEIVLRSSKADRRWGKREGFSLKRMGPEEALTCALRRAQERGQLQHVSEQQIKEARERLDWYLQLHSQDVIGHMRA